MNTTSSIPLNDRILAPKVGKIQGAFCQDLDNPHDLSQEMSEICFLPDGQKLTVQPGSSFAVKTNDTSWLRSDFYHAGQLTGPLIYSKIKSQPPVETLRRSKRCARQLKRAVNKLVLNLAFVAALVAATVAFSSKGIPLSSDLLVEVKLMTAIASLFSVYFLIVMARHIYALFKGGQTALDFLEETETIGQRTVPLMTTDRQLLDQFALTNPSPEFAHSSLGG